MASLGSVEWRAICDKFTNARNLTDVESRNDPENDPFRSKYKARELLREIYCSLKSFEAGEGEEESEGEGGEQRPTEPSVDGQRDDLFLQGFSGDSPAGLRAAKLGAVEYYLGVNHVDTEELSAGQEHLMNCLKQLEKCKVSSENVSLFIHVRVTFHPPPCVYCHFYSCDHIVTLLRTCRVIWGLISVTCEGMKE